MLIRNSTVYKLSRKGRKKHYVQKADIEDETWEEDDLYRNH